MVDKGIQQPTVEGDNLLYLQHLVPQQTPVKTDQVEFLLQGHPNWELLHEVVTGFKNGFLLKYNGPRQGRIHCNLKSAFKFPKLLQQHLDKEVSLHHMFGPFVQSPLQNIICDKWGFGLLKGGL